MRLLLILACCVLLAFALSGCLPPGSADIEVHINSDCNLEYADGTSANPLALEIRDKVKWVNDTGDVVHIDFGSGQLFGRKSIRLNAGKTATTTVKSSAAGYDDDLSVDCNKNDGSGNPKVVVGDDDDGG